MMGKEFKERVENIERRLADAECRRERSQETRDAWGREQDSAVRRLRDRVVSMDERLDRTEHAVAKLKQLTEEQQTTLPLLDMRLRVWTTCANQNYYLERTQVLLDEVRTHTISLAEGDTESGEAIVMRQMELFLLYEYAKARGWEDA